MRVVRLDRQDFFSLCGLTEALPCDTAVLIRSHGKSLRNGGAGFMNGTDPGDAEKKECCLISGWLSFSIRQGHSK
jgi:hypothetical protein